jgi:hypothetical protein
MRRNPLGPFDELLFIHILPQLDLAAEGLLNEGLFNNGSI